MEYTKLNNGVMMPMEGFGVFQVPNPVECEKVVGDALATGYRLLDTASVYDNETAVGHAIAHSGIARKDLFVTTKAWVSQMGYDNTLRAFDSSMRRLQLDYLDLYLIHMPLGDYYGSWRAMERLYEEGRILAIGVCNFLPDRLLDLCKSANVIPAVNQVECHPFTQQVEAMAEMKKLGVQIEAWAPLAEGQNNIFNNPVLTEIAKVHGKSVGQVILRWNEQRGVVIIPKSVHLNRIQENFSIWDFSLTDEEMARIATLDTHRPTILDIRTTAEVERLYNIPCPL